MGFQREDEKTMKTKAKLKIHYQFRDELLRNVLLENSIKTKLHFPTEPQSEDLQWTQYNTEEFFRAASNRRHVTFCSQCSPCPTNKPMWAQVQPGGAAAPYPLLLIPAFISHVVQRPQEPIPFSTSSTKAHESKQKGRKTETKHMKIGLTFSNDFPCAVLFICPGRPLTKGSQTNNKAFGLSAPWALTAQPWKCQLQQHRSTQPPAHVSHHITNSVPGCSTALLTVLSYFLLCLFSNRNIWLYKLLLEILCFLIKTRASFHIATYNTATTISLQQLLYFIFNPCDCNPLAFRKQITLLNTHSRDFKTHDRSNDFNDFRQPVLLLEPMSQCLYL